MTQDLWRWNARELAEAIASRQISSREAVNSTLERIAQINPSVNAITEVRAEEALAAADAADAAVRRGGPLPPLLGVPVTTKINVDQIGCATSNGVSQYQEVVAKEDSPAVANLRKAGAIPLARTNTPAFSFRWFTNNALHGQTYNPHDRSLTAGGSSGGASAAVATGMGALAHGNDQGGSVRYPAYACGVFGLRPTLGRVPAYNPSSAVERTPFTQISSVQGVLARNIADIRLGLEALSAPDLRDPWWVPVAPLPPSALPRKVALCTRVEGYTADPRVIQSLREAAIALEQAGYEVEEIVPPRFQEVAELWLALSMNETRQGMLEAVQTHGDDAIRHVIAEMLRLSPELSLRGYVEALAHRSALLREWNAFLQRYPVLLLPSSWADPFKAEEDMSADPSTLRRIVDAQSPLTIAALLGLPGLAVPLTASGMPPTGVQLIGGRYTEEILLQAGEAIAATQPAVSAIDPA